MNTNSKVNFVNPGKLLRYSDISITESIGLIEQWINEAVTGKESAKSGISNELSLRRTVPIECA